MPSYVFSVQGLRGPYNATDFINAEVPFVILFTVQKVSVGEENQDICSRMDCANLRWGLTTAESLINKHLKFIQVKVNKHLMLILISEILNVGAGEIYS